MRLTWAGVFPCSSSPGRQLAGADARQRAPGRGDAGDASGGLEEAELHGLLPQALPLILVRHVPQQGPGGPPAQPAAVGDLGGGGGVYRTLVQVHPGPVVLPQPRLLIHGPLLREEGQQALLHGVAVVMTAKNQFHSPAPYFMPWRT